MGTNQEESLLDSSTVSKLKQVITDAYEGKVNLPSPTTEEVFGTPPVKYPPVTNSHTELYWYIRGLEAALDHGDDCGDWMCDNIDEEIEERQRQLEQLE